MGFSVTKVLTTVVFEIVFRWSPVLFISIRININFRSFSVSYNRVRIMILSLYEASASRILVVVPTNHTTPLTANYRYLRIYVSMLINDAGECVKRLVRIAQLL